MAPEMLIKVCVKNPLGVLKMNNPTQTDSLIIERTDFIEILSAEFTGAKGYGVYAFLSFNDIERLYHRFLGDTVPAAVFVRIFVKRF